MPAPETDARHQDAVLWPFSRYGDDGQPIVSVGDRKQLCVRWVNARREAVSSEGNSIAYDATVIVDEDVAVGSVLWEGSEKSLPENGIPQMNLFQVRSKMTTPDLKGREYRRELLLMRWNDTLPTG